MPNSMQLGRQYTFQCALPEVYHGRVKAQFWFRNDRHLEMNSLGPSVMMWRHNGVLSLRFLRVKMADQAQYTCKILYVPWGNLRQGMKTFQRTQFVRVFLPPSRNLEILSVAANTSACPDVMLLCRAQKAEVIYWTFRNRDNILRGSGRRNDRYTDNHLDGTLVIHNAQPSDAGEYFCNAANSDGEVSKSITLGVECFQRMSQ